MKKTIAILQRNLLNFSRDKVRMIASFVMSFFFLFVFSFVMKSSAVGKISQPMNYLICGVIIMTVFQQAINNSTAILDDIANGFMKEILVAPISRYEISVGQILSSSVIAIVQGLIVLIAGMFMGLHMDVLHFIGTVGIMAVAGVTFGSIGLFTATVAKGSSAFQILSAVLVMPLTFLSGAYIPTTIMPGCLLPVVYLNPLTYITSIFRFITMHMEGLSSAQLVKEGVAYNIGGFVLLPQLGFLIIIAIGLCFFALCVHKFNRADFTSVKIYHHHKVRTYSLGMKQRLGMAQALLHKPELLVLDEPTNGLDPAGIKEMRELFRQLSENENMTILVSSHILAEIQQMCNRVAIINKGSLITVKTVNELTSMSDQKGAELLVKTGNDDLAAKLLLKHGMQSEQFPDGLHIRSNQQAAPKVIFTLAGAGIEVYELINQSRQSLEEVFMELTGDSGGQTVN